MHISISTENWISNWFWNLGWLQNTCASVPGRLRTNFLGPLCHWFRGHSKVPSEKTRSILSSRTSQLIWKVGSQNQSIDKCLALLAGFTRGPPHVCARIATIRRLPNLSHVRMSEIMWMSQVSHITHDMSQVSHITHHMSHMSHTGWRRLTGSPKLQIVFHKRATKYRSLLRKMTYKDKGSYESSPPGIETLLWEPVMRALL